MAVRKHQEMTGFRGGFKLSQKDLSEKVMAKQYYVQLNKLNGASRHTMTQSKL